MELRMVVERREEWHDEARRCIHFHFPDYPQLDYDIPDELIRSSRAFSPFEPLFRKLEKDNAQAKCFQKLGAW